MTIPKANSSTSQNTILRPMSLQSWPLGSGRPARRAWEKLVGPKISKTVKFGGLCRCYECIMTNLSY